MSIKNKMCFVAILIFLLLLTYFRKSYIKINRKETFYKNTKYILYWIPMWDSKTFYFKNQNYDLFKDCDFKNCFATHNRSLIPVENFDAIVFHAAQYNGKKYGTPRKRKPHQRYIFANMEPPTHAYPDNLHKYKYFYNWTMTYRSDSDIVRQYGCIRQRKTNYVIPQEGTLKTKTKMIGWFVSNCHTINKREDLYTILRQYLEIDVYGQCGTLQCAKEDHRSSSKCYNLLETQYKFYLAFENSHCRDYVTEKLFEPLKRNIVPIVYGDVDYQKISPPHSVIQISTYFNITYLVDYLLFLNSNLNEYVKYFHWKTSYEIFTNDDDAACKLCQKLNDLVEPTKVYSDIFRWWIGINYSNCKIKGT